MIGGIAGMDGIIGWWMGSLGWRGSLVGWVGSRGWMGSLNDGWGRLDGRHHWMTGGITGIDGATGMDGITG